MILQADMMKPLLEACPSFLREWHAFLEEWQDADDEPPLYLALAQLARHLIAMLANQDVVGLARAFEVVERWHVEGDAFVREAATIGLLESLQTNDLHESTSPGDFERFLQPESRKWWDRVERFWSSGTPISDD